MGRPVSKPCSGLCVQALPCAVCRRRATKRVWFARHAERVKAKRRAWYAHERLRVLTKQKARYAEHGAEQRARAAAYKTQNPEQVRASARNRNSGHSPEYFKACLRDQLYGCAVCDRPLADVGRLAQADHCHATGLPRGVLCARCNIRMAAVDDRELLAKLVIYRDHWATVHGEAQ